MRRNESRTMLRHAGRAAVLAAALAMLGGCAGLTDMVGRARGADETSPPGGIGPREHQLKRSPCACLPVTLEAAPEVLPT